jgi:hypothetical protein
MNAQIEMTLKQYCKQYIGTKIEKDYVEQTRYGIVADVVYNENFKTYDFVVFWEDDEPFIPCSYEDNLNNENEDDINLDNCVSIIAMDKVYYSNDK